MSVVLLLVFATCPAYAGKLKRIARDPYLGAIVIDNASGKVLFEDNADAKGYPASMVKLMDLLIILEKVEQGVLRMDEKVLTTAEASKIGGTQVWLKENEVFTIDELLYALIVQSANDVAVALAIHIAGSKDAFTELMNERAHALGMTSTEFQSVHGLPPGPGQKPDITTARDMAILSRELLKHPEALRYTSIRERGFRDNSLIMRTHNPLLKTFKGCDGLKTGYIYAAGFSIAVTAKRNNRRVIAIVFDCSNKKTRNKKAAELLAKGFLTQVLILPVFPLQLNHAFVLLKTDIVRR